MQQPRIRARRSLPKPRKSPRLTAGVRALRVESLEDRRLLTAMPYGATEFDLGEFLLGTVAVTPVFLESNGAIDAETETWSDLHRQEVQTKIEEGLQWWDTSLAALETVHTLDFTVDETFIDAPAETAYEPISRRSNDFILYVREFLQSQGYNSGSLEVDARNFNHAQREKHDTNWSFTIFVVNSDQDLDDSFASGGSFSRAFAFAGGLFMVVPSGRPASTFAHEMGHIFWGLDEYLGGGSYFSRRGYYNTQNLNAADNPDPGFVQQPSIMASGSLLDSAWENHVSPESTFALVGWQDSDNDGIFDVLDVPHRLSGSGYLDVASSSYRFQGTANVQTMPNVNSSGLQNDITLNRISQIEYRFDGGNWQIAASPDSYVAELDLSLNVPGGVSEVEIRAVDTNTGVVSNSFFGQLDRLASTPVPGINGSVWIDANENGLRDVGEYGQEFWTVELVDQVGQPLELRTVIEPDDYPDGELAEGFHPGVMLTSVGSDSDGRVGVFVDTQTSTGAKTFRGYSNAARSFLSSWNTTSRQLRIDFETPTSVVAMDAIGTSTDSMGRLEAFNSQGQLVGRFTTQLLEFGGVETMQVSRGTADIAYVIAGGHSNQSVRLDNLQFGPESQTLTGPQGQYAFPSLPAGDYRVRVTPGQGFAASDPNPSQQTASVSANVATTGVDFGFRPTSSDWQNPRDRFDVNDDGAYSPLDVLLIVNDINSNGARDLAGSGLPTPPYLDVSGDNFVTPLDVLLVVNFLNSRSGEGEDGLDWSYEDGQLAYAGSGDLDAGLQVAADFGSGLGQAEGESEDGALSQLRASAAPLFESIDPYSLRSRYNREHVSGIARSLNGFAQLSQSDSFFEDDDEQQTLVELLANDRLIPPMQGI